MKTIEGKPVEIGELTSFDKTIIGRYYATNRNQAKQSKDEKISIPKHLGTAIVMFFQDLGAESLLPTDPNDKVSYINRLHNIMVVENNLCPPEIDFNIIYSRFTQAVLKGEADPKGYSIKPLCDAFNNWIKKDHIRSTLYKTHYEHHPEDKPKELVEHTQETPGIDKKEYVDQSPEDVANQIRRLSTLYGGMAEAIKSAPGGKSYFQRLQNTYDLYKEQGKIKG